MKFFKNIKIIFIKFNWQVNFLKDIKEKMEKFKKPRESKKKIF